MIPKEFISGGITGLALIVSYLFSAPPVGRRYFLMNLPLFGMGWLAIGRRFFW